MITLHSNGTIDGLAQQNGIYVAMIKGIGAYNQHFEYHKNVTLIR